MDQEALEVAEVVWGAGDEYLADAREHEHGLLFFSFFFVALHQQLIGRSLEIPPIARMTFDT